VDQVNLGALEELVDKVLLVVLVELVVREKVVEKAAQEVPVILDHHSNTASLVFSSVLVIIGPLAAAILV